MADTANLNLKDLRYLVAVADERHFGRAAQRCYVSQPTLSAQLKKLEEYLGVQLIERQPKQITLTAAGEQIVARARRILEASDEVLALAKTHRDPLAGKLRIALLPTIGPYLLPRVARHIHKALPRLELQLYEYQTGPMLEKLAAGHVDLGILALPVDMEGFEARQLYEEPFELAMPAQHRLAKKKDIRVEDLKDETCCCSKTATACVIRRWTCAEASACRRNRTSARRAWKRCARWLPRGVGVTLLPAARESQFVCKCARRRITSVRG